MTIDYLPSALGDRLQAVALRLGGQAHGGVQFALLALHLLLLDLDLLAPLHYVDLDLLVSDLLPDLGGLELVG